MRADTRQTVFRHGGYEMRSHSETRWAAIMDVLHIDWLYETRTVETRHGKYLPDFYLPAVGMFVEVKGPRPSEVEREKALDAQLSTGCPVVFAYGRPEMLHGELFHGLISYFGTSGEVTYSTAEIGSAIRRHFDLHTYAAYLVAGEHQRRPDVIQLGEALHELVAGWMDRSGREQYMRSIHDPLNAAKAEICRQTSLAEWVMGEFAIRLRDCFGASDIVRLTKGADRRLVQQDGTQKRANHVERSNVTVLRGSI